MLTVTCPYCNQQIDSNYVDARCPLCNEIVMSEDFKSKRIDSLVRHAKRINIYDKLKTLGWNEKYDEAYNEIRDILKKTDHVIEEAFIARISQSKPSDWEYTKAPIPPIKHFEHQYIKLTTCPACNHQISSKAETCPNCGNPTGVHVCPKCGSTNTKTISGASKASSILLWGPFAVNKVASKFQCKDCWHKF